MNTSETIQKPNKAESANNQTREYWLRILRAALIVLSILAGVAFWGTFAYSIWSGNVELAMIFGQIIGIMIGVFVTVQFLYKLYQHIRKS